MAVLHCRECDVLLSICSQIRGVSKGMCVVAAIAVGDRTDRVSLVVTQWRISNRMIVCIVVTCSQHLQEARGAEAQMLEYKIAQRETTARIFFVRICDIFQVTWPASRLSYQAHRCTRVSPTRSP